MSGCIVPGETNCGDPYWAGDSAWDSGLFGTLEYCAGRKAIEFPIRASDRSQMPKKGVVTCSSRCQRPPSAGSLLWTSSAVRLVFHLRESKIRVSFRASQIRWIIRCSSYPVATEQNRSKLNMFQKTRLLSSSSTHLREGGKESNGFNSLWVSWPSSSTLRRRYSTVLVKEPTIDQALEVFPFPI